MSRGANEGRLAAGEQGLAAWKLPPIVAAIAVSIVAGFYLGGPGLGMAIGGLAAATIVVMAVRHPPRHPIVPPPAADSRPHLLVLLDEPLEDGGATEAVARMARRGGGRNAPEVLLLSPSRHRFLDRWASALGPGRDRAQRNLVLSVASLAKAEVEAKARVGDEDVVQMVEDELRSFPATEVVLITTGTGRGGFGSGAVRELETRLEAPFRRILAAGEDPAEDRRDGRSRASAPLTLKR